MIDKGQSLDDYIEELLTKESHEARVVISVLYMLLRHFVKEEREREEYFEQVLDRLGKLIAEEKATNKE